VIETEPATQSLHEEVVSGLRQQPKVLPSKFFYDRRGSLIFERICGLEEYYLTRVETRILRDCIDEIGALCGSEFVLVELGSGSSTKTRLLIDNSRTRIYVPVDISRGQLFDSAKTLSRDYPSLEILPLCTDYTRELRLPPLPVKLRRTIVFFPGSSIGNFEPDAATSFLGRIRAVCSPEGGMLIGVDLKKPKPVIERAYNDAKGVTAAFNLNLLLRANREMGADFDLDGFRHQAIYNEERGRIEMRLVSVRAQTVHIGEASISFLSGEHITTEHSYKYTLQSFKEIARRAGFEVLQVWTDADCWFGVFFLASDETPA
jgi:dimethylhistidine N-methyltransferase